MLDQKVGDMWPKFFVGSQVHETLFNLFYIISFGESQALTQSKYVRIDGDSFDDAVDVPEDDGGSLSPYAGEGREFRDGLWKFSLEVFLNQFGGCDHVSCFGAIEADPRDFLFKFGRIGVRKIFWRFVLLEKPSLSNCVHGLIGRLCRHHDGSQELHRRLVDERGFCLRVSLLQYRKNGCRSFFLFDLGFSLDPRLGVFVENSHIIEILNPKH